MGAYRNFGSHSLKARLYEGATQHGTMEKLGKTAELVIEIGTAAADLSTQAKNNYQWFKDGRTYLQELLELDARAFRDLEKAIHKKQ